MSDSSSEDENLQKLQQAVDTNFINDSMFNEISSERECSPVKNKPLPSLRNVNDEQDTHRELHVTPEFQKHVAKHLSQLIEKQLKEVQLKTANISNKPEKNTGVKLLQNSTTYVLCEDEIVRPSVNNKRKVEESNSEEENEKVAMAAVSSDWVLNKKGIEGWAKQTKGEVIQGVLVRKTKKKKKQKKEVEL